MKMQEPPLRIFSQNTHLYPNPCPHPTAARTA
jgi:hypothetical protein